MSPTGWTRMLDLQEQLVKEGVWYAGSVLYWKLNPSYIEGLRYVEDRVARHVMEEARALATEGALGAIAPDWALEDGS